jgi:eukaryotic-like serine/threonine-protein kinase
MAGDDVLFEGKFRIGELLGEGGMGVVHAALNIYSGARVAIKRIPVEIVERHALSKRLLSESRVLALLDHQNIVRLLDCGPIATGGLYIVMELVEGDSLRALIRRAQKLGKVLDLDLVLPAVAQIAEAMDYAHCKSVCHRDLKPENVMIRPGGHVKVLDFGLAKGASTGPLRPVSPTSPARVVGTPRYMAPEQVRARTVDGRADIYALGVILYEAISGHTPYDQGEDEGSTDAELMGHHVHADPTPICEHVPHCPERIWQIILRCLAKDPKDRYADMGSLAKDLRAALDEMVAPDEPPPAPAPHEARVTAPMPEHFRFGDPLPFAVPGPAEAAPREVRETEPMPAAFTPAEVVPFVPPPEPQRFGKGYTGPMLALQGVDSPEGEAGPAEPAATREALPPSPNEPPAAPTTPPEPTRDSTRSGPGFVFDPTVPDASRPWQPAPPPSPTRGGPRHRRVELYALSPLAGLVIAVGAMIAVMKLRDPTAGTIVHVPASAPTAEVSIAPAPPPAPAPPTASPATASTPTSSTPTAAPTTSAAPAVTSTPAPTASQARRKPADSPLPSRSPVLPVLARPSLPPPPTAAPHRIFGSQP